MKSICRISISFIIAIYICCFTLNISNIFAIEDTWQNVFLDLIDNYPENNGNSTSSAYLLCNIDDDEIPELYMWDSSRYTYALYTQYEGKAILCDEFSYKSAQVIYSDKSGYFWSSVTENANLLYNIFYKLDNGSCSIVYSFCHDLSDEVNGKYMIDNKEVSKGEFESIFTDIEAKYPISNIEYMVNGKLEYTYDEIKQYLNDSMNNQSTAVITTVSKITTTTTTTTTSITINSNNSPNILTPPETNDTTNNFIIICVVIMIIITGCIIIKKINKE